MKKLLTYLIISASVFILVSCDKPAPTQLVDDTTDEFEVELLNKDLENPTSNGTDTSGITQDLTGVTNLISVSGIKISSENRISEFSLAQTMFFDKNQPIHVGSKLIAYKSIVPGTIKFNGTEAHIVPFRIRYREGGIPKDTLVAENIFCIIYSVVTPIHFTLVWYFGDQSKHAYHERIHVH